MSRRQTQAPLSPTQLNIKGGNGAGRFIKDGGAPPGKARKSIAPGVALGAGAIPGLCMERRSSFMAKPSGPKQDPRPLNNKEFQANCIKTIINYLTTHNFTYPVSAKTLTSPTGKDFSAIVMFLFQQIDPAFRIQGKVEDEVPVFFKRLNYPYQLSKSALFAVGTPHSWPGVLGALTWLVEVLEYGEKVNNSKGSTFDSESKIEYFMEYLAEGYQNFMSGDDDRCQELDEQFIDKFSKQEAEVDMRCQELQKANEQLLAEVAQLRSLPDPVDAAKAELNESLVDNEKLEQIVQQDQSLKQSGIRKLTERKADVQAKQDQITAMVASVEELRQRVASQVFNKADVSRFMMERNMQDTLQREEEAKCEDKQRKVAERVLEVERAKVGIGRLADDYNVMVTRLQLVPATSKRAGGINYALKVSRDATSLTDFLNLDLKGVVIPNLERLCETYRTRASQMQQDLMSLREACAARLEACAEKEKENEALRAEVAKLEAQFQKACDAQEEKCRRLNVQAEGIMAQVDEFYSAASNRTEHMEEQISRAQQLYEQTKRESEAELAKLESDLKKAIKLAIAHREFVTNTIQHTAAIVRQVKTEITDRLKR